MTSASAESQANSPLATYAAVDNSKRKGVKKDDTKHTAAAEKYTQKVLPSKWAHKIEGEGQFKLGVRFIYMHLQITMQDRDEENSDEVNPPLPVEELYTAVKKKPKGSNVQVNEPVSQAAEDLYTAVTKKPKENAENDVIVPSIPLYTIEELYTAVNKKPTGIQWRMKRKLHQYLLA